MRFQSPLADIYRDFSYIGFFCVAAGLGVDTWKAGAASRLFGRGQVGANDSGRPMQEIVRQACKIWMPLPNHRGVKGVNREKRETG